MMPVAKVTRALHVLFSEDPAIRTGRNLSGWGERFLGLNMSQTRTLVHAWKNVRNPVSAIRHYALAKRRGIGAGSDRALDLSEGCAPFDANQIEGGTEVVKLLQRLFQERCVDQIHPGFSWAKKNGKMKEFLRDCFFEDDFIKYPELADFVLNDTFLQSAIRYFGAVPRLGSIQFWWSPANSLQIGSQNWHFDDEDRRQLKVFMNVFEVTETNGPLTFLPASTSRRIRDEPTHKVGRLEDAAVDAILNGTKPTQAVGPGGAGYLVDTVSCLHQGSRTQAGDRVVMMIQFIPHNVHRESKAPPRFDASRYLNDPVRHLIASGTEAAYRHN